MQLSVVTGMSGSGKTQVVRFLEDQGYFCVDNMPPILIEKFVEMVFSANGKYDKIAFVIDVRVGEMINLLLDTLATLKQNGYAHKLLFLDASDDVLVKRYKETRRTHPIADPNGLLESIRKERVLLEQLKNAADYVIDTSAFSVHDLMDELREIYSTDDEPGRAIKVHIMAFGFKYGLPLDSDLVFDVRCFPNPFYVDDLKKKTGNDREVQDYVMGSEGAQKFLEKLIDMTKFLLPLYIEEGKNNLTIAIGCTGGRHRSVTLANKLAEALGDYQVNLVYRDIERG